MAEKSEAIPEATIFYIRWDIDIVETELQQIAYDRDDLLIYRRVS